MSPRERSRFDELVDEVVEGLPDQIRDLLDEKPLFVEDRPSAEVMRELGITPSEADEICGLHTGPMATERTVEPHNGVVEAIHLYREGVVACSGGWSPWREPDDEGRMIEGGGIDLIREEIRITLLHELGHHFGLDEDDLEGLGFA
ncbi:MAG: metallopeptidase family protein [Planctomycetota bacterium]|jgi:predicted Zn-dependent protease with MMP-like domain